MRTTSGRTAVAAVVITGLLLTLGLCGCGPKSEEATAGTPASPGAAAAAPPSATMSPEAAAQMQAQQQADAARRAAQAPPSSTK